MHREPNNGKDRICIECAIRAIANTAQMSGDGPLELAVVVHWTELCRLFAIAGFQTATRFSAWNCDQWQLTRSFVNSARRFIAWCSATPLQSEGRASRRVGRRSARAGFRADVGGLVSALAAKQAISSTRCSLSDMCWPRAFSRHGSAGQEGERVCRGVRAWKLEEPAACMRGREL